MSAPAPSPKSDPPAAQRDRLTPPRLLLAVAFAVVGFVAVWQGFAAAGCGNGAHPLRVIAVLGPLFAAGLVLAWPRRSTRTRVGVALLGIVLACAAWWLVPAWLGEMSLCEAVAQRDELKKRLVNPTFEDMESGYHIKLKLDELKRQYQQIGYSLDRDFDRWLREIAGEIVARSQQIPDDDIVAARAFEERVRKFAIQFPGPGLEITIAMETWAARARHAKVVELERLPPGDWEGFNRTAPGREALASAFYPALAEDNRAALVKAEEEWVKRSAENGEDVGPPVKLAGGQGAQLRVWHDVESEILALKSLDTSEGRFKEARQKLFVTADNAARELISDFIAAGQYDRAFGLARKHAVEWNATATSLGPDEVKKLDSLRETCEFFDKLASKATPPPDPEEIAPPPRAKPEK